MLLMRAVRAVACMHCACCVCCACCTCCYSADMDSQVAPCTSAAAALMHAAPELHACACCVRVPCRLQRAGAATAECRKMEAEAECAWWCGCGRHWHGLGCVGALGRPPRVSTAATAVLGHAQRPRAAGLQHSGRDAGCAACMQCAACRAACMRCVGADGGVAHLHSVGGGA
jgi:hypothetical protein